MAIIAEDDFNAQSGTLEAPWIDLANERWNDITAVLAEVPVAAQPYRDYGVQVRSGGLRRDLRVTPRVFSPITLDTSNERAVCQARTICSFYDPHALSTSGAFNPFPPDPDDVRSYSPELRVGHFFAYQDLEQDDDIEVGVRWYLHEHPWSITSQVSPAVLIDPHSSDPTEMGLLPISDISLGSESNIAWYIQNAFRCAESVVFDWTSYYRLLGANSGQLHRVGVKDQHGPVPPGSGTSTPWPSIPGAHDIVARLHDGKIAAYLDDELLLGPWPVPEQFKGRQRFGLHVIANQMDPRFPSDFPVEAPDHDVPVLLDRWWAADFTGPF